jgi:chromosomal replication initiation ATPase DnaA
MTESLPVLCIEEVDRVNLTGWARETLHRLLDARYNQRRELLTVLASNLAPEQLPADFGYLASRMRGGQVVEVAGLDMRPAIAMRERVDIN